MDMSHRFVAGWEGVLFLDNGHWSLPSLLPPVVGISVLFAIIVRMDK